MIAITSVVCALAKSADQPELHAQIVARLALGGGQA